MSEGRSGLKNIFVGSTVSSQLIQARLKEIGVITIVKDHFHSGNIAGFAGDIPENLELYVLEDEFIEANEIISQLIREGRLE